jgi:hypothetical protein
MNFGFNLTNNHVFRPKRQKPQRVKSSEEVIKSSAVRCVCGGLPVLRFQHLLSKDRVYMQCKCGLETTRFTPEYAWNASVGDTTVVIGAAQRALQQWNSMPK